MIGNPVEYWGIPEWVYNKLDKPGKILDIENIIVTQSKNYCYDNLYIALIEVLLLLLFLKSNSLRYMRNILMKLEEEFIYLFIFI